MHETHSPRWLRVFLTNRHLQAALGVLLVVAASLGIGGVLLHRAHAAATFNVATTGADSGTCGAVATPCLTIQQAITNASNGDTIAVAAGTYAITATINVTKSVTILGAQAGVDARTRSGAESVVDATAVPSGTGNGFDVTASNVTIDGFTITGAIGVCVTAAPADHFLFQNNIVTKCNSGVSELAGDGITIQHNLLEHMGVPVGAAIVGDAIYDDFAFTNMVITENDILSSGQAITIPNTPGKPAESITISNNHIENCVCLFGVTGSFTGNTVNGNGAAATQVSSVAVGVELGGEVNNFVVDHNSFSDFQWYTIKVVTRTDFGYTGNNQNIQITNNTMSQNVGLMTDNAGSFIMRFDDVQGTSNVVSGNVVTLSGTFGAGATVVYGIKVGGAITTLDIKNNVLNGGGVGGTSPTPPTSGIEVDSVALAATSQVNITGNLVTTFVDGVNAPDMTAGATFAASQNCFYDNSANGAVNGGSGAVMGAANNWWGTPNGPIGPGNPGGTGNAVSSNVTFMPFLGASIPTICAAPTTTLSIGNPQVTGSPVQVSTSTPLTLNAAAGYQPVGSVHYRFYPQGGTAPAFTVVSGHTASFNLSGANGTYVVEWYSVDVTTNEEVRHTQTLALMTITPGLDVNAGANVPQTGSPDTGPASPANANTGAGAGAGTASGTTQQPAAPKTQPKVSHPATGAGLLLWEEIGIGVLLLLVVLGGVGLLLLRARRIPSTEQPPSAS